MILHLLELFFWTGAVVPAILGVAWALWELGVRDPFILTLLALVIGGPAGWGVNVGIAKLIDRRTVSSASVQRRPRQ